MEAKLIKINGEYLLNPSIVGTKLSLKNCQAIENGYDLDELVEERFGETFWHDGDKYFKEGFQKALEILGDKKFSEEDMRKAYFQGDYDALYDGAYSEKENKFIQSLQQTEWEVEIEMELEIDTSKLVGAIYGQKPKLNAENCLILKRK